MPPHTAPTATGPLAGVRVIELGQIAAGPFAGSLFADLGADVVKIERPDGGDGMRQWPPVANALPAPTAVFECQVCNLALCLAPAA